MTGGTRTLVDASLEEDGKDHLSLNQRRESLTVPCFKIPYQIKAWGGGAIHSDAGVSHSSG